MAIRSIILKWNKNIILENIPKNWDMTLLTSETVLERGWGGYEGFWAAWKPSGENPRYVDSGFNSAEGFATAASGYRRVDQGCLASGGCSSREWWSHKASRGWNVTPKESSRRHQWAAFSEAIPIAVFPFLWPSHFRSVHKRDCTFQLSHPRQTKFPQSEHQPWVASPLPSMGPSSF